MTLTLEKLEAEFWALEREQPTRARLKRVVMRIHYAMVNETNGGDHAWIDEFFFDMESESSGSNALLLLDKLQTEIGELRTEVNRLKSERRSKW